MKEHFIKTLFVSVILAANSWILLQADEVPDAPTRQPGKSIQEVHFQGTDYELNVYRIYGRENGKTILIIGGIHGDEPGGYLSADKFVDISLLKGNLIIVPRANLHSILTENRGSTGDYNRKFSGKLDLAKTSDRAVAVLKQLISESDVLLNLHDGSGFYREERIDSLHGPYRYGQSIIIDTDLYDHPEDDGLVELESIANSVIESVNSIIDNEEYLFRLSNHNSISPDTKHPEMRKTATYFALTEHGVAAFGVETSKNLPSTDMKVQHQVAIINAFLDEYEIIPDIYGAGIEEPHLEFVVFNINNNRQAVVKNGETLAVEPGDKIQVAKIIGNYERNMYADYVGIGGRNDNEEVVDINGPVKLNIRKDSAICGSVNIKPIRNSSSTISLAEGNANYFVVDVNGEKQFVQSAGKLVVTRGDKVTISDYLSRDSIEKINVNFEGFVGNPNNNLGEDRGYTCDTAKDLLKNWSVDGKGNAYVIAAKRGRKTIEKIILNVIDPEIRYLIYSINGGDKKVLSTSSVIAASAGDELEIVDITLANGNSSGNSSFSYSLQTENGTTRMIDNNRVVLPTDLSVNKLSLAVSCNQIVVGSYAISATAPEISR